ncbi:hypothetical protein D3C87_2205460 [compost metagenome]
MSRCQRRFNLVSTGRGDLGKHRPARRLVDGFDRTGASNKVAIDEEACFESAHASVSNGAAGI